MAMFDLTLLFPEKQFSDFNFENRYSQIKKEFENSEEVIIDFRFFKWFDLWAIIQLLILIDQFYLKANKKGIQIILLNPDFLIEEKNKSTAYTTLNFLFDMEFLHRAKELGCKILLQQTAVKNDLRPIDDLTDLQKLILYSKNSEKENHSAHHIIPITRLETLDIGHQRERLFLESRAVFENLFTEAIIQEATLGDCILAELVSNAKIHGDGKGYVAMRAVGGLRRLVKDDESEYVKGQSLRTKHPLKDWRRYFQDHYEEGYFELIVIDQGEGISSTITKSETIPRDLLNNNEESVSYLNSLHKRIHYALDLYTSSLSQDKRKEKNLTELTGLGAISSVLTSNDGCLLIREKSLRHIFYGEANKHFYFSGFEVKKDNKKSEKGFAEARGTAVTALVPMRNLHTADEKYKLLPKNSEYEQEFLNENTKFYKLVDLHKSSLSYVEELYKGETWKTISEQITELPNVITAVLVDVKNISVEKNYLWKGIVQLKQICDEKRIGFFLSGLDTRIVARLNEWAAADAKLINENPSWIILGFSDDSYFHLIGLNKIDHKERERIVSEIGNFFCYNDSDAVRNKTKEMLSNSNYLRWTSQDDTGYMNFRLKADYSFLKRLLKQNYAEKIENHIKKSSAWKEEEPVKLIGGDVVSEYLCIHSVTQIEGIYPDFARLIKMMSHEFSFNFVLTVGTATRASIAQDLCNYYNRPPDDKSDSSENVIFYSYQDYFSFDHGESTKAVMGENSNVLIIVDGIRKKEHCDEAIDHVLDCDAKVAGIITLIDLNGNLPNKHGDIPLRYVLRLPVSLEDKNEPMWLEDPYSHKLRPPIESKEELWKVFYEQERAYHFAETFGIIQKGHTVFLERHHWRSFALSYLFHTKTTLSIELINKVVDLIKNQKIDTIVYPEHSAISKLIEIVRFNLPKNRLNSVVCRRATYPGKSTYYTLNILGKEMLSKGKRILVIDDQCFSGNSLKSMINLTLKHSNDLKHISVFVVIESMLKAEKKLFTTFLRNLTNKKGKNTAIGLNAFMSFPVFKYWTPQSCPVCKLRNVFEKNRESKYDFIESQYAKRRLKQLEPHWLNLESSKRMKLTPLNTEVKLKRPNRSEVSVATIEGYELFCESSYVEGDIKWLVERINPERHDIFPPEIIISVIELLTRDVSLLFRVRLRKSLLENLVKLIRVKKIRGSQLGLLLETLSQFPLFCLKDELWESIWTTFLNETEPHFNECYEGAQFLLQDVNRRSNHTLRKKLLNEFEEKTFAVIEQLPNDSTYAKKKAMLKCLLRSYRFERPVAFYWLIDQISQLLKYPITNAPTHHQILYKDLIGLSNLKDESNKSDYIATIQMLKQLQYLLALLARHHQIDSTEIKIHLGYDRFNWLLNGIEHEFGENFEESKTKINDYARELLELLFLNRPEFSEHSREQRLSFKATLEGFIDRYHKSLAEVLKPILELKNKGVQIDNIEIENNRRVVFDDKAVKEVFEELARNFDNHNKGLQDNKNREGVTVSRSLFSNPTIKTKVTYEGAFVLIEFQNLCSAEDRKHIEKGGNNGIKQITKGLEKFGYEYDKDFNETESGLYFVQKFKLRLI